MITVSIQGLSIAYEFPQSCTNANVLIKSIHLAVCSKGDQLRYSLAKLSCISLMREGDPHRYKGKAGKKNWMTH